MSQVYVGNGSGGGGGGSPIETLTGNTGGAQSPTANNINIITANATPVFAGSTSELTLNFGLTNIVFGSSLPSAVGGSAVRNAGLGFQSLNAVTTGEDNTAMGWGALENMQAANQNTAFGSTALAGEVGSNGNVALGYAAMVNFNGNTAQEDLNTAVGTFALGYCVNGSQNIGLGYNAGSQYGSNESSNIVIGNVGVASESNVIRIGTQGTSVGQQNQCYVAGIVGNTVSNAEYVTVNSSTGQLGVASVPSGTLVLIQSQTASNVANLTFNTGITSTYNNYLFTFNNVISNDAGGRKFYCQVFSGGSWQTANYFSGNWYQFYTGSSGNNSDTTQIIIAINETNVQVGVTGQLQFYNVTSGNNPTWLGDTVDNLSTASWAKAWGSTTNTNISGFRFYFDSTNILSGTINLYGIVN